MRVCARRIGSPRRYTGAPVWGATAPVPAPANPSQYLAPVATLPLQSLRTGFGLPKDLPEIRSIRPRIRHDRFCRCAPHDGRLPGSHQRRHRSAPDRRDAGRFRASGLRRRQSAELAYLDLDLPVEAGRRLLKPMVLAKLLQAAEIGESDRVLDRRLRDRLFRGGDRAACRARWSRSSRTQALARLAKDNLQALGAQQRHGGDRSVGRGLARWRSLRCDSSRRCRRGSAARPCFAS